MKLRLKSNSIRLRLGRSELAHLLEHHTIKESTPFTPLHTLTYVLSTTTAPHIAATFEHNAIHVRVPLNTLRCWAASPDLSLSATQPINDSTSLSILIEKDLECRDPATRESQLDAFPNPAAHNPCPDHAR